jgi:4,5-dihydroxyphthalate decarboxylase
LAVGSYDRTRAIFDGRAPIEGCDVVAVALEPEEAFHRAFRSQEFDVTEISLSSHTLTTARGEARYIGVPAFVSRLFRHSSIYIRTRYSHEQGLSPRRLPVEEMFAAATLELSKI